MGTIIPEFSTSSDKSIFDILPGYWMWRQDPTIEALVHNHETWPGVIFMFGTMVAAYSTWTYLGRVHRHTMRPLFVVNKKTWLNTKVPRKRSRFYDRKFMQAPEPQDIVQDTTWKGAQVK